MPYGIGCVECYICLCMHAAAIEQLYYNMMLTCGCMESLTAPYFVHSRMSLYIRLTQVGCSVVTTMHRNNLSLQYQLL